MHKKVYMNRALHIFLRPTQMLDGGEHGNVGEDVHKVLGYAKI